MKISVVIPVYNVARWIEASLRSVAIQNEPGEGLQIECIVVDDCGIDTSMEIVERLCDELRCKGSFELHIIRHITNRGQAAARNTGTAAATGEYIFYLDGDDFLEPYALLALARVATKADYPDWVQGNFLRVSEEGRVVGRATYHHQGKSLFQGKEQIAQHFDQLNFVNATNKLIRLDFIQDHNLFFREGLTYEDLMWCMEAYRAVETIATLPEMVYRHNLREGSIMRSAMTDDKMDSLLYVIRELGAMTPRDLHIEHVATRNTVFGLKNLYLWRFSGSYRKRWIAAVWEAGVPAMAINRAHLSAPSRLVSYALSLSLDAARVYLQLLMGAYRFYLSLTGGKKV